MNKSPSPIIVNAINVEVVLSIIPPASRNMTKLFYIFMQFTVISLDGSVTFKTGVLFFQIHEYLILTENMNGQ